MKLPLACKKEKDTILCDVEGKKIKMESCRWSLGSHASCVDYNNKRHSFPDVLFPPNRDEEHKIEEKTHGVIWHDMEKMNIINKNLYLSGHLGDIGETGDKLVIKSYFNKIIVREIEVKKDNIILKAGTDEPINLPKNLSILYEPWALDRGSFVFFNPPGNAFPEGQLLKFGTEWDILEEKDEI